MCRHRCASVKSHLRCDGAQARKLRLGEFAAPWENEIFLSLSLSLTLTFSSFLIREPKRRRSRRHSRPIGYVCGTTNNVHLKGDENFRENEKRRVQAPRFRLTAARAQKKPERTRRRRSRGKEREGHSKRHK